MADQSAGHASDRSLDQESNRASIPTSYITLDGNTGEGGGQLVRIACALAAVATRPVCITNVRGNRAGHRGGGLKSQHVTAIEYLKTATGARVDGLSVGSHTLKFDPQLPPAALKSRNIKIHADSPAASTLLIFQAVFPFLLFAGNDKGEPITLEISGGTNVAWSLSFEYLDQVLLPTLESAFGIAVKRRLLARGWSSGRQQRGTVEFKFTPIKPGETLRYQELTGVYGVTGLSGMPPTVRDVTAVDVSMIAPAEMHNTLEMELGETLGIFDNAEINFKVKEDSGADSRIYILLVAKAGILRWGRDWLQSTRHAKIKKGNQTTATLCEIIARKLTNELYDEVSLGVVDEFLQDQMVVFQALAEGRTSFLRGEDKSGLERSMDRLQIDPKLLRVEKTDGPIGEGSEHTRTARWVTAQMLDNVKWCNKGNVCEGAGLRQQPRVLGGTNGRRA